MKYENVEFERNFQLKPTVQPTDEPTEQSASNSICAQSQTEKTHDDIQVLSIDSKRYEECPANKNSSFLDSQGTAIA